jgi:regulator of protease activity HflC (stomatin/prohibitin superfamily)
MDLGTIFNSAAMITMGIAALAAIKSSIYIVPQRKVGLVTQFGRHMRTDETPGLKFKAPWPIQNVAAKVSTAEQQVEEMLQTKTTDDLFVNLPIAIQFEVNNAAVFYFNKDDPVGMMSKAVSAAVREYTSGKSFQELYNERQEIRDGVLEKVADKASQFGIVINDIIIDEPQASAEVRETFDRVRRSALEKEAAKNEADANYIRTVKDAEADKERDILRGEGAAGYREKIFDQYAEQIEALEKAGTPREEAVKVMMKIMELDTWREVGGEGNSMVIVGNSDNSGADLQDFVVKAQALGQLPSNTNAPKTTTRKKASPKPG